MPFFSLTRLPVRPVVLCLFLALTCMACEQPEDEDVDPGNELTETDPERIIPVAATSVTGTGSVIPIYEEGRAIFVVSNPGPAECLFTLVPLEVENPILEDVEEYRGGTAVSPGTGNAEAGRSPQEPVAQSDTLTNSPTDSPTDSRSNTQADTLDDAAAPPAVGEEQSGEAGDDMAQEPDYLHQSNVVAAGSTSRVTVDLTLGMYEATCASEGRNTQPSDDTALGGRMLILVTEDGDLTSEGDYLPKD